MASKRRNIFYENKKQETMEIEHDSALGRHLQFERIRAEDGVRVPKHVLGEQEAGDDGNSETGRVLTTMKAGDFFGEIGILNLDGLNKRTADVRSVGYSELFSLSREDVLTAMKDYPEAQEILQSLGRKRLMEARNMSKAWKNSAQQKEKVISPPSTGENLDDSAGKRIVEKIRSDVKELKNVLRKSKRGSRSRSDCTEMESVSKTKDFKDPSSSNKGILCRMTRISHEDSTQDDNLKSPSGPGLPILHRLKHLKDKQESDGAKKSPYQSTNQNSVAEENKDSEVIGQGLPLLQRLMLLKQKEANDSAPSAAQAAASTVRTQHKSPSSHIIKARRKSKEDEDNAQTANDKVSTDTIEPIHRHEAPEIKVEQQDADKNCLDKQSWTILRKATVLTGSMSETSTDAPKESSPVAISFQVNSEQADPIANVQSSPPETAGNQHTAGKLMERSVVTREKTQVPHIFSPLNTSSGWGGNFRIRRAKKRCSPLGKPKIYKSIDDLSPEYSGLPFVKKLKILNERQKIAELERDQFVRSSSLDSAGSVSEPRELTRSHSEAVAIEVVLRNREAAAGPTSPEESDETPERRKLKSILKKLSTAARDPAGRSSPLESDYSEMKRLMRAQTVEGYAARHSKLTKSVTFDRAGSDSSPSPNLLLSQPPNAPSHPRLLPAEREPTTLQPPQVIETEFIRSGATPKSRGIEHFGDIFLGIKEIIQEHLDEIRDNYVNRLSSLELELRRRDSIISQLQKRIQELEQKTSVSDSETSLTSEASDHPFTREASIETVLSQDSCEIRQIDTSPNGRITWNNGIRQLSANIPQNCQINQCDCTQVEIGSETSSTESEDELKYNTDWEIQMLVQEMNARESDNRKRSVSFDSARVHSNHKFEKAYSFESPSTFCPLGNIQRKQFLNIKSLEKHKGHSSLPPHNHYSNRSTLQRSLSSTIRSIGQFIRGNVTSSPNAVPTISSNCNDTPQQPPNS